jgi:hypothetical protein
MSFWLREIFGWFLVIVGLLLFYECYRLVEQSRIFELGPLSIIGIVVFRGGVHLLKVAVAARICREARDRTKPARPASTPRRADRPVARVNPLATRES